MKRLTVRYFPNDDLLEKKADGVAEKYVMDIVKELDPDIPCILCTSQEMIVNWVRVAILRGLISPEDVEFTFENNIMFPDKYGRLDWWPKGFCDYNDNIVTELLQQTFFKTKGDTNTE